METHLEEATDDHDRVNTSVKERVVLRDKF